jgi:enamine deaminase RidA (YjgF/YER057c/UK114 family)
MAPAVSTAREPALQAEYCAPGELQQHDAGWWDEVLAVVRFDPAPGSSDPFHGIPSPPVLLPVLGGSDRGAEIWRLAGPLRSGQHGRVRFRGNERLLFAALWLPEGPYATAGITPSGRLRAATRDAYAELFAALGQLGCPHPLRIWNYLPRINAESDGAERYWHFNDARRDAFVRARRAIRGDVPAASALGTAAGDSLCVYCIAGCAPPLALENPRQCSAWQYPPQYGPQQPIFARACIEAGAHRTLFISGTASIVGHASAHAGDVIAQTRETLDNIRALVGAANEQAGGARYGAERLLYKVYVRRPGDQPRIEQTLRRELGPVPPLLFLQADICRRELLVEIEAVGT